MRTGRTRVSTAALVASAVLVAAPAAAEAIPTLSTNGTTVSLKVKCKAGPAGTAYTPYSDTGCRGSVSLSASGSALSSAAAGSGNYNVSGNRTGRAKLKLNGRVRKALRAKGSVVATVKLRRSGGTGTASAAKRVRLQLRQTGGGAREPGFTG